MRPVAGSLPVFKNKGRVLCGTEQTILHVRGLLCSATGATDQLTPLPGRFKAGATAPLVSTTEEQYVVHNAFVA